MALVGGIGGKEYVYPMYCEWCNGDFLTPHSIVRSMPYEYEGTKVVDVWYFCLQCQDKVAAKRSPHTYANPAYARWTLGNWNALYLRKYQEGMKIRKSYKKRKKDEDD